MSQIIVHRETHNLRRGLIWHKDLPKGAIPISANVQGYLHEPEVLKQSPFVSVWFSFPVEEAEKETFLFAAVETGNPVVLEGFTFLDTILMLRGTYVVHIYYKNRGEANDGVPKDVG